MRGIRAAVLLAGLMAMTGPVTAQSGPEAPAGAPVLTIEPDRLIRGTLYGRAVQARLDDQARSLQAENRRIDAELEAEEKALTERRATLPAEEFRALAATFDEKVEGIRQAQEAKGRALAEQGEAERQKVIEAAVPILADLMAERGAVAILNKESVFLSFDRNDITDDAIRRLDAVLGDGTAPPPDVPDPAPPNP